MGHPELSIRRQSELLGLNRSSLYYKPAGETSENLRLMRLIDEQYTIARRIVEANREKVEAMALALLEFETLDADQIGDIMAGLPPRPPKPLAQPPQQPPKPDAPGATTTTAPA